MRSSKLADTRHRPRRFSPRARVSVDVSPRGAKFRPKGPYRVGTELQLQFITPDGGRLHVLGVVWRADADGVAVLFLGTIPEGFDVLGHRP